jgi:hypothetical protein
LKWRTPNAMTTRAPNLSRAIPTPGAANRVARLNAGAILDVMPFGHPNSAIIGLIKSPIAAAPAPVTTKPTVAKLATIFHRACERGAGTCTLARLGPPIEYEFVTYSDEVVGTMPAHVDQRVAAIAHWYRVHLDTFDTRFDPFFHGYRRAAGKASQITAEPPSTNGLRHQRKTLGMTDRFDR